MQQIEKLPTDYKIRLNPTNPGEPVQLGYVRVPFSRFLVFPSWSVLYAKQDINGGVVLFAGERRKLFKHLFKKADRFKVSLFGGKIYKTGKDRDSLIYDVNLLSGRVRMAEIIGARSVSNPRRATTVSAAPPKAPIVVPTEVIQPQANKINDIIDAEFEEAPSFLMLTSLDRRPTPVRSASATRPGTVYGRDGLTRVLGSAVQL